MKVQLGGRTACRALAISACICHDTKFAKSAGARFRLAMLQDCTALQRACRRALLLTKVMEVLNRLLVLMSIPVVMVLQAQWMKDAMRLSSERCQATRHAGMAKCSCSRGSMILGGASNSDQLLFCVCKENSNDYLRGLVEGDNKRACHL